MKRYNLVYYRLTRRDLFRDGVDFLALRKVALLLTPLLVISCIA